MFLKDAMRPSKGTESAIIAGAKTKPSAEERARNGQVNRRKVTVEHPQITQTKDWATIITTETPTTNPEASGAILLIRRSVGNIVIPNVRTATKLSRVTERAITAGAKTKPSAEERVSVGTCNGHTVTVEHPQITQTKDWAIIITVETPTTNPEASGATLPIQRSAGSTVIQSVRRKDLLHIFCEKKIKGVIRKSKKK